jgi:hypothetical protein
MRTCCLALLFLLGFGLASCNRRDEDRRGEPAARQAGRDAYRASQEIKQDAKKAEKQLRDAGKEFREGWNEKKREDRTVRQK